MLRLRRKDENAWSPPIVETSATDGTGIAELLGNIRAHREWLVGRGELERRRANRRWAEVERLFALQLTERAALLARPDVRDELRTQVLGASIGPWDAAERLLAEVLRGPPESR
jgi:LAO/AO transport system kinase